MFGTCRWCMSRLLLGDRGILSWACHRALAARFFAVSLGGQQHRSAFMTGSYVDEHVCNRERFTSHSVTGHSKCRNLIWIYLGPEGLARQHKQIRAGASIAFNVFNDVHAWLRAWVCGVPQVTECNIMTANGDLRSARLFPLASFSMQKLL
jgi:hypothetical protein